LQTVISSEGLVVGAFAFIDGSEEKFLEFERNPGRNF